MVEESHGLCQRLTDLPSSASLFRLTAINQATLRNLCDTPDTAGCAARVLQTKQVKKQQHQRVRPGAHRIWPSSGTAQTPNGSGIEASLAFCATWSIYLYLQLAIGDWLTIQAAPSRHHGNLPFLGRNLQRHSRHRLPRRQGQVNTNGCSIIW